MSKETTTYESMKPVLENFGNIYNKKTGNIREHAGFVIEKILSADYRIITSRKVTGNFYRDLERNTNILRSLEEIGIIEKKAKNIREYVLKDRQIAEILLENVEIEPLFPEDTD